MPLTAVQRQVLLTLAPSRSAASYVAGGSALNRAWSRLSLDIDIFHDDAPSVVDWAMEDIALLEAAGFRVSKDVVIFGVVEATVTSSLGETMVQWMDETTRRFFPIQQDPEFGFRLHDADLAVNKVIAAATRSKTRDAVDVAMLCRAFLPLGHLAWAAAGKTPLSPADIMERIVRNAASHGASEYAAVRSTAPVDGRAVLETILDARTAGAAVLDSLPEDTYGHLFVDDRLRIVPATAADLAAGRCRPHGLTDCGAWPSFPGMAESILDRWEDRNASGRR